MTHFVKPKEAVAISSRTWSSSPAAAPINSFECIGNVDVMRQALECATALGRVGDHRRRGRRAGDPRRAPSSSSPGACGRAPPSAAARGRTDVPRSSTGI